MRATRAPGHRPARRPNAWSALIVTAFLTALLCAWTRAPAGWLLTERVSSIARDGPLGAASSGFATTLPLFLCALAVLFGGFVLGWAGQPLMGLAPIAFASRLQCAYRFNTYIGIAIAGKLHGALGVATMGAMSGAMVPFANILAVSMLARHGQGSLARELLRNPLVLATLAGLGWNLAGFELVEPAQAFLKRLGDAAVTLGLRAGSLAFGWRLPVYKARPPRN